MAQPDIIQTILRDSNYHLDLFEESEIQDLRQKVEGGEKPFIHILLDRPKTALNHILL